MGNIPAPVAPSQPSAGSSAAPAAPAPTFRGAPATPGGGTQQAINMRLSPSYMPSMIAALRGMSPQAPARSMQFRTLGNGPLASYTSPTLPQSDQFPSVPQASYKGRPTTPQVTPGGSFNPEVFTLPEEYTPPGAPPRTTKGILGRVSGRR